MKDPKIMLIFLMLLFVHQEHQNVSSCINLCEWPKGFCHPLTVQSHLCRIWPHLIITFKGLDLRASPYGRKRRDCIKRLLLTFTWDFSYTQCKWHQRKLPLNWNMQLTTTYQLFQRTAYVRMYWSNFRRPTVHVKRNVFERFLPS